MPAASGLVHSDNINALVRFLYFIFCYCLEAQLRSRSFNYQNHAAISCVHANKVVVATPVVSGANGVATTVGRLDECVATVCAASPVAPGAVFAVANSDAFSSDTRRISIRPQPPD